MKLTYLARSLVVLATSCVLLAGVSACTQATSQQSPTTSVSSPVQTTTTSEPPSTVPGTETPSVEPSPLPPSIGGFSLGLSPEDLLAMLQQQTISLTTGCTSDPMAAPAHPVKDGRCYSFLANGDKGYIFYTEPLTFTFSSADKLVVIVLSSSGFPTEMGLQVGDTTAQMKQLYGGEYKFYDDLGSGNEIAYEFQLSAGSYLDVDAENQSTTGDIDDAVITGMRLSSFIDQEGD